MKIKGFVTILILISLMLVACTPTGLGTMGTQSESGGFFPSFPNADGEQFAPSMPPNDTGNKGQAGAPSTPNTATPPTQSESAYGTEIESLGVYDGIIEGETTPEDIKIVYVSGTQNAYTLENNILTFGELSEDSVYQISGKLNGAIVIDIVNDYKLELELSDMIISSDTTSPITILSGNEVKIQAKKDTSSYIYDNRAKIDESDETLYSGAIHSLIDLEIGGKGTLKLVSEENNGVHSKKDLQIKNLTLLVICQDNALKGNDGIEITDTSLTLIAKSGDAIKTTNSDLSSKGNQRGGVVITGSACELYSACDGIDASYDVVINEGTVLNIYTDKYSSYSGEVTEDELDKELYYIRFSSNAYKYSVKYYNSDSDIEWVNAEYHSSASGGRSTYYYYSFPKRSSYEKLMFFIYSSDMALSQEDDYLACSDYMSLNDAYDTIALSNRGSSLGYSWTNYTTSVGGGFGGMGGMQEGNSDKGEYSTKGIKASNQIVVNAGEINIKSYDDALHAKNTDTLENGESPLGKITINGGTLTLYSNDDGIHADGELLINDGSVRVENSYEGVEGSTITLVGGSVSVIARDDGMNATSTQGTAITIKGGELYVYCSGDGLDTNSRASYAGIGFEGGRIVVITTSGGNSAIDTEAGYSYTGGQVLAIMPQGGMSSEATHASNFSSIGTKKTMSLSTGQYLSAEIGDAMAIIKMPVSISAYVIVLGDSSATLSASAENGDTLNLDGVLWK
ncbi:MAG: carbohydrate-binding domain-containing protein [Clostridia bacterium]|nr:carbohydrate-binding domain-containing protein [Clostridia bacterium]